MFLSHWIRTASKQLSPNSAGTNTISLGLMRLEDRRVLSASGGEVMLFSVNNGGANLPGLGAVEAADIVSYDGNQFELFFDASDVGLTGDVDAFAMVGENQFMLSLLNPTEVPGLGTVDGRDIILFEATSLGDVTEGTFSWVLHGEQLGLPQLRPGNIDALELLDDGSLAFSLEGRSNLPTGPNGEVMQVEDTDVIRLTPDANGVFETGTMELLFDGSDALLQDNVEDIDALSINGSQWRLSTWGGFFNGISVQGSAGDVFTFNAEQLGEETIGTYEAGLFFDGSVVTGLTSNIVDALDFATLRTPNAPPTAQDVSVELDEDGSVEVQLLGDDGDGDLDQTITYEIIDGPEFGSISNFDPATGTFTYTPNADFSGSDQLTYVVHEVDADGNILSSEPASVHLTVHAVNDAPIVHVEQSQFTGEEGQPVVIHGLSVDDLEAGFEGTLVVVTLQATDGTLSVAESTSVLISGNDTWEVQITGTIADINQLLSEGVIFQPDAEFSGMTAVNVVMRDQLDTQGALTASGTVQVEITAVPDAPPMSFRDRILQLVDSGELKKGHANFLLTVVKHQGDHGLADNAIKKVEKWEMQGRIGSELADELIGGLTALDPTDHDHGHGHKHKHGHKHDHGHKHGDDHDHGHKQDHGHKLGHGNVDEIFSQIGEGRNFGRFRV